jgi:hypothetical protein
LGFSDIAASLIDALKREKLDPVTLGVFGDWGSGKTSILEITEAALAADANIAVIFTHPWEYDPRADAKATLISEILSLIEAEVKKQGGLTGQVLAGFKALRDRVQWSKAVSLVANTAVTLSIPSIDKIVDVFGGTAEQPEQTLQGFREEFSALMTTVDGIDRVVVLVDDLDRCLPGTVVATLEAIKLFLSVPKMGFVIAADERLVRHAIATQYAPAPNAETMAREYLEKIVQIPIRVPALGPGDIQAYLALLLLQSHLPVDHADFEQLISHCAARRTAAQEPIFEDIPDGLIPAAATDDLALAQMLAPVLSSRMSGNPRRLKRFLNAYWVRGAIAERRSASLNDPPALAKLMVLEELEREQFGKLLDLLSAGELETKLSEWEQDAHVPSGPDAKLQAWAHEKPHISGIDLGPYLRLAASLRALPAPGTALRSDLQALLDALTDSAAGKRKAAQSAAVSLQREDRLTLGRALVEAILARPRDQAAIGESLQELIVKDAEGEVVQDIAERLRALNPSDVQPALITRIWRDGQDGIRETVRGWSESGALNPASAKLAKEYLEV